MLKLKINGKEHSLDVDADTPLLWVLRDHLDLVGTKIGCGMSLCGACTVHVDDLESRSAELARGNFRAIDEPVGGIAEIRRLQAGLAAMAHRVEAAQKSLHDYIGAITLPQEEERRRRARELHDETIQSLIALKQRLQLVSLSQQDGFATDSLDEVERLTEQNIESLRRLTRALRPIYLEDLGLPTALEMLVRETNLFTKIEVGFERTGSEKQLEPDTELALYRMSQEALTNAIHHSNAT